MFDYLANPTRFMRLADYTVWPLRLIAAAGLLIGSWLGLASSPADYQQGDAVRLMYVHVCRLPGWPVLLFDVGAGQFVFHCLAASAGRYCCPGDCPGRCRLCLSDACDRGIVGRAYLGHLVGLGRAADLHAGAVFFFIGYLALANGFDRPERGARPAAILAMVGVLNLPIVKFSVDWWNTLHQPASILRSGGMAIDSAMLWPLFTMFAGLQAFFLLMVIQRMRLLLGQARLARLAGRQEAS